jgi:hypothetical protein
MKPCRPLYASQSISRNYPWQYAYRVKGSRASMDYEYKILSWSLCNMTVVEDGSAQRRVLCFYFWHLHAWKARHFSKRGKSGVTCFGESHAWRVGSIFGYVGTADILMHCLPELCELSKLQRPTSHIDAACREDSRTLAS